MSVSSYPEELTDIIQRREHVKRAAGLGGSALRK